LSSVAAFASVSGLLGPAAGLRAARAAEVTRVVSGQGSDRPRGFDFNLTLWFVHDQKRALVKREHQPPTPTPLIKDAVYRQLRDVVNARVDIGLLADVGLHVELPFVVRDDRQLAFDQSAGAACSFPEDGPDPSCVNQQNSTLLRDGILPGYQQESYGVDARNVQQADGVQTPARFAGGSPMVFRGPRRRGLEALGVGVSWAVFNQVRDPSKPTWTMGLDGRLDLFGSMRYDAARPASNTGVGLGYHQLIASTFLSKRMGALDPFFGAYYLHPLAKDGGLYARSPSGSQPFAGPQRRAGVRIGVEMIPWEDPASAQRVVLELGARAEHRFQGRSASELWEPLSGRSDCAAAMPAQCRPGVDFDGLGRPSPHPGVTETQAYTAMGADIALGIQAGKHTRFRGLFGFATELPHFISFATAGEDLDGDGRVDASNASEANPTYRETIDIPGRRFKVEGTQIWTLSLEASVMF
jgi:hypothetical protein